MSPGTLGAMDFWQDRNAGQGLV
ncbi:protein of unknown function [Candidatus Methylocalor cossyra]|uniref:Uncharacterized protein n=1 Tax=Candidatus Methylocalor cossyra TaxID=3108543 RepID=A0ABM9NMN1_9GAMM